MTGRSAQISRCFLRLLSLAALLGCLNLHFARADEHPVKASSDDAVSSTTAAAQQPPANQHQSTAERIRHLIRDLGSPQYTTRRSAANELRQIGAEAFDLLYAATDDADPEIAASANYLLRQIPVRWIQPDDSNSVRNVMRNYAQETETARLASVDKLDRLADEGGNAALCRIARYDRSPVVSRSAAMAVIRPDEKPAANSKPDLNAIERELGTSGRPPVLWLRQYLMQLRDPATSIAGWKRLIDQESATLDKAGGDTTSDIVLGLTWNLADLYRQLGDRAALNNTLDHMIGLASESSDDTLCDLLAWLTENKSWDALDTFLTKQQARIDQSKRPLYYAALAREKQGKHDVAEDLASKAAVIPVQPNTNEGLSIAKDLEERSKYDWAVREYRQSIEKSPKESIEHIIARLWLSELMRDYDRNKDAADTLEPLVNALNEGNVSRIYSQDRKVYAERLRLPSPGEIAGNYHFYRACQYQSEKDLPRAKSELDLAINFDPKDADVLIAMYRFPQADPDWHRGVVDRIHKMADKFQRDIDDNPRDPSNYNQWAWLISNTEGDFHQAVRYSHKSLELNNHGESGESSFLDTLGRCYFAAGDFENAVKFERQAIEKNDHLQVMRRQLAEFEQALAKKKGEAPKSPSASGRGPG
jgi:tetratricopeptide (TPR) repeat protein